MIIDETKMAENVKLTKMMLNGKEARIYDNCMPDEQFILLKTTLMGENFPWCYNEESVLSTTQIKSPIEGYDNNRVPQFVHVFFRKGSYSWSPYTEAIKHVLDLINPSAWIRVKANLGWKKDKHLASGWHHDITDTSTNQLHTNSITAQLYINTNNGYTLFETGDKIESVENRLVIFPCDILHTGISTTDVSRRILLNFNFFI